MPLFAWPLYLLHLCSRTFLSLNELCEWIHLSFDASLHPFLHTHFFSCKETVCSICSVGNCFYLLQKNSSIIHCAVFKEPLPFRAGGDKQNRTADPLLARQVLSQLSYTPISEPVMGLEPATCWLQISCSANWATPACVQNFSWARLIVYQILHCLASIFFKIFIFFSNCQSA